MDLSRVVVIDEKWFSEEKGFKLEYEASKNSPVKPNVKYKCFAAETGTQEIKLMYLAAVAEGNPIGLYELNFKAWNAENVNPRTGRAAKGICGAYIAEVCEGVFRDAQRILGPGPIYLWMDKASCHKSKVFLDRLEAVFDGVIVQPGKSPDFNLLDAHVFPMMEQRVEDRAAKTKTEIRAAVEQ
eukprot:scaffold7837_cov926-Pinguiococcus_pyrenoidosus.AAC.1